VEGYCAIAARMIRNTKSKSDKTDHVAMHKGAALTRFWDVDGVDLKPGSGPVDPIDLTAMNQPDQDLRLTATINQKDSWKESLRVL
jgi:hypothetical protein